MSPNPLTAVSHIFGFLFFSSTLTTTYYMLKVQYDINQQYLKTVDLHLIKSE